MVASTMNKDLFQPLPGPGAYPCAASPPGRPHVPAGLPWPAAVRRFLALSVPGLAFALAACSAPMDKHPDIKLNPHPVQRYELTATVDAPGPFDSVTGYVSYDVTNLECVPKDAWEGARNVPSSSHTFELTRVDDHTWKGYFYRDLLKDEDYFGLGVCHWEVVNALPVFTVHAEKFSPALVFDDLLGGDQTRYFSKTDFFNRSLGGGATLDFSGADENVRADPERYFPISVKVRETEP
jgi:hypothetical protein